jgi:hypothetical protein
MKVHELIAHLAQYDPECDVLCPIVDIGYEFNGECSEEVIKSSFLLLHECYIEQDKYGNILIGETEDSLRD